MTKQRLREEKGLAQGQMDNRGQNGSKVKWPDSCFPRPFFCEQVSYVVKPGASRMNQHPSLSTPVHYGFNCDPPH